MREEKINLGDCIYLISNHLSFKAKKLLTFSLLRNLISYYGKDKIKEEFKEYLEIN